MGVSQLLGKHVPGLPPKVYAYGKNINSFMDSEVQGNYCVMPCSQTPSSMLKMISFQMTAEFVRMHHKKQKLISGRASFISRNFRRPFLVIYKKCPISSSKNSDDLF